MRTRFITRAFLFIVTASTAFLASGCVSNMIAKKIVEAPNHFAKPKVVTDKTYAELMGRTYARSWLVPVPSPKADIAVALIEPGKYHLRHELEIKDDGHGHGKWSVQFTWKFPAKPVIADSCRGTIVLLHGILMSKEMMLPWALYLADAGYRTVLVDLRGHGQSSGDWIGYGAFEVNDLKYVLDDLEKKGLVSGRIGVMGISYGASVALQLAGRDSRVAAVVAIEPFSDPQKAVVEFGRGYFKNLSRLVSNRDFVSALKRATTLAHFSWSDADVLSGVARTKAPILFFHGEKDTWVSPENSRLLSARSTAETKVVIVKNDDHVILAARLDPISTDVLAWFDRTVSTSSLRMNYAANWKESGLGGFVSLDFKL